MKLPSITLCPVLFSLPTPKGHRYLPGTMQRPFLAVIAAATLVSCRPATAPVPVTGAAAVARAPLPPIPLVEGAVDPKVVYPQPNQMIQSRDSNFIFGSLGNGRATLTINGQRVPVAPNGAFLGYVANPVPTDT